MKRRLLVSSFLLSGFIAILTVLAFYRVPPATRVASPDLPKPLPVPRASIPASVATPSMTDNTSSAPLVPEIATPPPEIIRSTPAEVTPPPPTPSPTPEIVYSAGQVDPRNPDENTVSERVRQYGPAARKRLAPFFLKADVPYPPARVLLVGLKQEQLLKVYASTSRHRPSWRFVCQYPIVASGVSLGPKLREGDRQTPEGLYRIMLLNPESSYHLSMGINYPNEFDLRHAKRDKRTKPGSDIMIHGSFLSDGCLAMGDTAATDLFVLVADSGMRNTEVLLSPVDFRMLPNPELPDQPAWVADLYTDIRKQMSNLEDGVSTEARLIRYRDTCCLTALQ